MVLVHTVKSRGQSCFLSGMIRRERTKVIRSARVLHSASVRGPLGLKQSSIGTQADLRRISAMIPLFHNSHISVAFFNIFSVDDPPMLMPVFCAVSTDSEGPQVELVSCV